MLLNVFTADALSEVKDQNVSDTFRKLLLPNGQTPAAGLFTTRPDLAEILDKIAINGISEFYNGNLTKEIASVVCLNPSKALGQFHTSTYSYFNN